MDHLLIQRILCPLPGMLIAVFGKWMLTVKPNYFFGFRLPWILKDPKIWKETHQFAGKIWLLAGIIYSIISIFLSWEHVTAMLSFAVVIIIIIPIIYSCRKFGKP
jgi:uncharacterized membrane protein